MTDDQQPELFPETGQRRSVRQEPLRVFLVEDNDDIVEVLAAECEEIENVEVIGRSASADDAIERIIASEPDVVLIDIQLRTGSGIDVIRALRRNTAMPGTVLLAMSNALSDTVRGLCLAAGADDYFDKAMDYRKLLIRVADLAT